MKARTLAWVVFRCFGVVTMILGVVRVATTFPVMRQMTWATGTAAFFAKMFLPSGAEFLAGLVIFLLAKRLSELLFPQQTMMASPNMRVQRTRSSASPPHSPLTRRPLGDPGKQCLDRGCPRTWSLS